LNSTLLKQDEIGDHIMNEIILGFEIRPKDLEKEKEWIAKPVTIEPNHTFICGTTGTGKSKAMQRLIQEAEGTVLIIDAKRNRDYAGMNADIPLYIKQQMEPIVIKDSIETTERFTIKQQFGTLLDTVADSESWDDMLEVIEREMKTVRSGYIKNNLKILRYFIKRLVKEHEKFQWSDGLELNDGINVLNISKMSIQMQQLVVGSAINYIQDNLTNITVIIDEAHRFVPQGQTSGCSRDIVTFIREGRASSNWLWLADQTMTGISKDLLKQMQYWILGRQSELNEAERTVKQIPRAKSLGVNTEAIQTLGLGEFLVVSYEWAKITYIWPIWITEEIAMDVALGKRTAKSVARLENKSPGDDDMAWKGKYTDLSKEHEQLKRDKRESDKKQKQIITGLEKKIADIEARMVKLDEKTKSKKKDSKDTSASIVGPSSKVQENPPTEEIKVPESISVETIQPKITIIVKQPPLTLNDEDVLGRVAILYADGMFPIDTWLRNNDITKGFLSHGWPAPNSNTLRKAMLQLARWGYVEHKITDRSLYKFKISTEKAREMGLLQTTVAH